MEDKKKIAPYNKKQAVLTDLFEKKCHQMFTRKQLIEYLMDKYGYTYETSVTYYEDLMISLKDYYDNNYEANLAQSVEWLEYNLQSENMDAFTRLQYMKELNKIKNLHINKVQVEGQITNVEVIRLTEVKPAISEGDVIIPLNNTPLTELPNAQKE